MTQCENRKDNVDNVNSEQLSVSGKGQSISEIVSSSKKQSVTKKSSDKLREKRFERLKICKQVVKKTRETSKLKFKDSKYETINTRNKIVECSIDPETNELKVNLLDKMEIEKRKNTRGFDVTKINFIKAKEINSNMEYEPTTSNNTVMRQNNHQINENQERTSTQQSQIYTERKVNQYRTIDEEGYIEPPTKKVSRSNTSKQISQPTVVKNRFGIFQKQTTNEADEVEMESDPTPNINENKKVWIPPITITDKINDYMQFNKEITNILGHRNFYTKFNNNMTAKLYLKTMEDHKRIINDFKKENTQFYTQTKHEDKVKKIVLKAAPGMDEDDVKEELESMNYRIKEVVKLKSRQHETRSYLISVPIDENIGKIKQLTNLGNLRINWEKYNKKNNWTQCRRCQQFGHSQINCNNEPRCVKCPGHHLYTECKLIRGPNTKAFCHNCDGDHAANYHQCPALIEYLERRNINIPNRNEKIQNRREPDQIQLRNTREFPKINRSNNANEDQENIEEEQNRGTQYRDRVIRNSKNEENTDLKEILQLISIIKKLKNELKECTNAMDKALLVLKYIDHF